MAVQFSSWLSLFSFTLLPQWSTCVNSLTVGPSAQTWDKARIDGRLGNVIFMQKVCHFQNSQLPRQHPSKGPPRACPILSEKRTLVQKTPGQLGISPINPTQVSFQVWTLSQRTPREHSWMGLLLGAGVCCHTVAPTSAHYWPSQTQQGQAKAGAL